LKSLNGGKSKMQMNNALPLALGATLGGIIGKIIFNFIKHASSNEQLVLRVQSIALGVIILGCIIYTLEKRKISTLCIHSSVTGSCIGIVLGIVSSFLGIGGGPINLIVLNFFYGYNSKEASKYSLFIVLLSQFAALLTTIFTNEVPKVSAFSVIVVILAGLCGGIIGKGINKKIDNKAVDKMFLGFLSIVLVICVINTVG
jgi:hypothetical protein